MIEASYVVERKADIRVRKLIALGVHQGYHMKPDKLMAMLKKDE